MPIKTQSAKAKGRKLQQHVAKRITEEFNLGIGDVESTSMGAGGIDIKLSPVARAKFPISIECKNTKTNPTMSELRQAEYNKYPMTIPVVAWHPPRVEYVDSLVILRFEDLIKLVKRGNSAE